MPRGFRSRKTEPETTPGGEVPLDQTPDTELPGQWERADFTDGQPEVDNTRAIGADPEPEPEPVTELEPEVPEVETPPAPEEVPATEGLTLVPPTRDAAPAPAPALDVAPYANQYDWTTATWTAPRGSATKPCGCNRLVGHGCELTTKSRFATGHDARFKGILQKAFRNGQKLAVDFEESDRATVEGPDGNRLQLVGRYEMEADEIARLLAPKLLPHVTHDTRAAKLQKADAVAGTTVPQTAVDARPDEELTDADLEAQVDDAPGSDAEFVEA